MWRSRAVCSTFCVVSPLSHDMLKHHWLNCSHGLSHSHSISIGFHVFVGFVVLDNTTPNLNVTTSTAACADPPNLTPDACSETLQAKVYTVYCYFHRAQSPSHGAVFLEAQEMQMFANVVQILGSTLKIFACAALSSPFMRLWSSTKALRFKGLMKSQAKGGAGERKGAFQLRASVASTRIINCEREASKIHRNPLKA